MADPVPKIELQPPDIEPYRAGNTGIDYVCSFDSGRGGPNVLITALVHGNELCGAITLDFLLRNKMRPKRGRLTLAFANVAAFQRFDPASPTLSRFVDEDFNRLWSPERLDSKKHSIELDRARQLRPVVEAADFLLDLHSMQHVSPPVILCGPLEKGRRFAREVGVPETVVSDGGHIAGPRMRDYGAFADRSSPKNSLLVECGQHWEISSEQVAKSTALHFLAALDLIEPEFLARHPLPPKPKRQRMIEVTHPITVTGDRFTFVDEYRGLELIEKRGTEIGRDGGKPVVTPYDDCVLVMPSRRLAKGQTAVRLGRYIK